LTRLYGYRAGSPWLGLTDRQIAPGTRIIKHNVPDVSLPAMRSYGPNLIGAALPHPDPNHMITVEQGLIHRFASAIPPINEQRLERFREFVKEWIHTNMTPLSESEDLSFETWLASTNYPEKRKEQLRKIYYQDDRRFLYRNKSHIKDEPYVDFKHSRWINSRSDLFKCLTGPFFKLIEKKLFQRKEFIKYVPVPLRARYIKEHIYAPGSTYIATDYTSYEASFGGRLWLHVSTNSMNTCAKIWIQISSGWYLRESWVPRSVFLSVLQ